MISVPSGTAAWITVTVARVVAGRAVSYSIQLPARQWQDKPADARELIAREIGQGIAVVMRDPKALT